MNTLNDQVKQTLQEVKPALVATAAASGKPNVSAKGSLRVIDDTHVAFANVASPRTVANIQENDKVAIIVLGDDTHKACRIWGTGKVMDKGEVFDQFAAAMKERNMTIGQIVLITVEEVEA